MDHMSLFNNILSFIAPEKTKTPARQENPETFVLIGSCRYEQPIISTASQQPSLEALYGPHVPHGINRFATAWLVPEENNPRDKETVRVVIHGKTVGYLRSSDASLFRHQRSEREMPNAIGQCQAVITGGWVSSDGRKGPFEVWLDLPSAYR
jgi:hypothetical protein